MTFPSLELLCKQRTVRWCRYFHLYRRSLTFSSHSCSWVLWVKWCVSSWFLSERCVNSVSFSNLMFVNMKRLLSIGCKLLSSTPHLIRMVVHRKPVTKDDLKTKDQKSESKCLPSSKRSFNESKYMKISEIYTHRDHIHTPHRTCLQICNTNNNE